MGVACSKDKDAFNFNRGSLDRGSSSIMSSKDDIGIYLNSADRKIKARDVTTLTQRKYKPEELSEVIPEKGVVELYSRETSE